MQFIRQKFTENRRTPSSTPRKFCNVSVNIESIVARVVSIAHLIGGNFFIDSLAHLNREKPDVDVVPREAAQHPHLTTLDVQAEVVHL